MIYLHGGPIIIIIIIIHAFIFASKIKEGQTIKVEVFESEALWKELTRKRKQSCDESSLCYNFHQKLDTYFFRHTSTNSINNFGFFF